ncbi:hypothetical protein EV421DRAFT_1738228 [Armillaria borealis]|uniref:Uncharacterized protein n=1 Tax=Armillaria borealis TaxID=47425 RepID=A0AA39IW61_9AGAR|nr:hypothetical protein EV421DRAFT_1744204 [Armillaria borealis]KAK0438761.1 hypothetical protein EV421DRAFT_1738228 [Armillaria borealis]
MHGVESHDGGGYTFVQGSLVEDLHRFPHEPCDRLSPTTQPFCRDTESMTDNKARYGLSGCFLKCNDEGGWSVGKHRGASIEYRSLNPFRRVVFSGTMRVDGPWECTAKKDRCGSWDMVFQGCASASTECRCLSSSSSVVFGMYSESYLLCQLTCVWEARRLCSTSTECTRFMTWPLVNILSFETDVSAHREERVRRVCRTPLHVGARREMDLHRSGPVRRRVDETTRMVGPVWDFWVYPPSITVTKGFTREYTIQTEQELSCSVESQCTQGGEDGVRGGTCMREGHTRVRKEPYAGRDVNGRMLWAIVKILSFPRKYRYLDLTIISTPLAKVQSARKLWDQNSFFVFLHHRPWVSPIDRPETLEKGRRRVWHFEGGEGRMMAVEMEGRAWFNWENVLVLVVQYIMVFRFLEAAMKLDVSIAFQQFQREPAGW